MANPESLNIKQKAFVMEYLKDLNAKQAAIRAGYSAKTAESQGSRLLTNAKVQQALTEAMQNRAARTMVTQDRVVTELAKIAFSDASDLAEVVTEEGENPVTGERYPYQMVRIKETRNLTADQRATLAQIKEGKHGIEVSRYDKLKALELLGRHLGMFELHEAPEEDPPDDGFLQALKAEAEDTWME